MQEQSKFFKQYKDQIIAYGKISSDVDSEKYLLEVGVDAVLLPFFASLSADPSRKLATCYVHLRTGAAEETGCAAATAHMRMQQATLHERLFPHTHTLECTPCSIRIW